MYNRLLPSMPQCAYYEGPHTGYILWQTGHATSYWLTYGNTRLFAWLTMPSTNVVNKTHSHMDMRGATSYFRMSHCTASQQHWPFTIKSMRQTLRCNDYDGHTQRTVVRHCRLPAFHRHRSVSPADLRSCQAYTTTSLRADYNCWSQISLLGTFEHHKEVSFPTCNVCLVGHLALFLHRRTQAQEG